METMAKPEKEKRNVDITVELNVINFISLHTKEMKTFSWRENNLIQ